MDRKKKRPANIELNSDTGELIVQWRDGHESRFSLVELRRNCPCASCRKKHQAAASADPGELVLLDDEAATATSQARRFDPVGRYGIRITWADGHDYGIYSFESLRTRDEEAGQNGR